MNPSAAVSCILIGACVGCGDSRSENALESDFANWFQVRSQHTLEAPADNPIGRISQVLVYRGKVIVVDDMSSDLKLFTERGEYVGVWGGAGDGPGEYRSPIAIGVVESDRLAVLDQSSRVTLLSDIGEVLGTWRSPVRLVHSMQTSSDGKTIVIGGTVLDAPSDLGAATNYDAHVFDLDGRYRRSVFLRPEPAAPAENSFLGTRLALSGGILVAGRYSRNTLQYHDLQTGREWARPVGESIYEPPIWSRAKGRTIEDAIRFAEPYLWLQNIIALPCGYHLVTFRRTKSRASTFQYVLKSMDGTDLLVTRPTEMEIVGADGSEVIGAEFLADGSVRVTRWGLRRPLTC